MFWDIFIKLCAKHGKKPNPVAKELGFGTAAVTHWKNGAIPRDISLRKIADYFGVTVDYLLGNEAEQKEKPADEGELAENVIIWHRDGKTNRREFTRDQMEMLERMINAIPEKPKDNL